MPNFQTVSQVVSLAARELGLVSEDISNPYASDDPNILLLTSLLTSAGREIIREHNWSQSIAEHTFVTSASTEPYNLPSDFLRMLNQTGWDRTSKFPLGGPLSAQEWQYLDANSSLTVRLLFRPFAKKFQIHNTVPASHSIAFEYMSSYWVAVTAAPTVGTKDAPTISTDVLLFDTHLMSRALKRAFRREKGFPTQTSEEDYQKALAAVMRDDTPAPVLSLNGRAEYEPMLSPRNLPSTGWG